MKWIKNDYLLALIIGVILTLLSLPLLPIIGLSMLADAQFLIRDIAILYLILPMIIMGLLGLFIPEQIMNILVLPIIAVWNCFIAFLTIKIIKKIRKRK